MRVAFAVIAGVMMLIGIFLWGSFKEALDTPSPIERSASEGDPLPVRFWEEKLFYDGLQRSTQASSGPISGAIIPHHLVGGALIADLFSRLKEQRPHTIIIIGPNHYEVGEGIVISSRKDWQTPFGLVITNRRILDALSEKVLLSFDDEVMLGEHSTQGILPYVGYFTPEASVVQLVISGRITKSEIDMLARALEAEVKKGAVVVAAVDFSHHLNAPEAAKRDEVTLEVLAARDIDRLLELSSEYLDSPASIALLIRLMEQQGKDTFVLEHHTNSGEIVGDRLQEVTSYITGIFR